MMQQSIGAQTGNHTTRPCRRTAPDHPAASRTPIPPGGGRARATRTMGLLAGLVAGSLGLGALPAGAAREPASQRATTPKDNRVWVLARADDTLVLRYGAPGAADPVFAVACQPSAGLLQFTVEVTSAKIRSGDGVAVALQVGKRRLELAASAFRGATDGQVVAEAAVALEDRVLDLFADGDILTVRLPGSNTAFPLAGAKAKVVDFRRACLGRK
ncbi:hypothetical protein [Xanthobacter sp. ZOL 2024]